MSSTLLDTETNVEPQATQQTEQTLTPESGQTPQTTEAGNPAPYNYGGMIQDGGVFSEDWKNGLPEDVRGEASLNSIHSIAALAKSYVSAQHKIGVDKVFVPGKNATAEEIAAYQKAIGIPESADGYELKAPDQMPEGLQFDEGLAKDFAAKAKEFGLTKTQAQNLMSFQVQYEAGRTAARERAEQAECVETEGKLRQEWGDKFDEKLNGVKTALKVFAPNFDVNAAGLGRNYQFLNLMANIAEKIGESSLNGVSAGIEDSARSRYDELMNNKESAFWDTTHPGHNAAVSEIARLSNLIFK